MNQNTNQQQIDVFLLKWFPYYKSLEDNLKVKFIKRVQKFLQQKEIIARQCENNLETNILIAATAVQLSFGLSDFLWQSFNKILVYPSQFYSTIRKQYHKGEINTQLKIIVLSASHFLDGIANATDGINLGLHEFAHAIHYLSYTKNIAQTEQRNWQIWEKLAQEEMICLEMKKSTLLRNYATTNIQEMFAVSTEVFFEQATHFYNSNPKLYMAMAKIYKQDPKNATNPLDYYSLI